MSMVLRPVAGLLAGLLVAISAQIAAAQGTNPFGRTPTSLKDSEMPLILGTVDRVLREYRVGATASWRSAETGRAGQSTITGLFQRQGWRCAQVTHHFTAGGGGTFTAPLCETEPGSWKFAF
jgi:surface antigen